MNGLKINNNFIIFFKKILSNINNNNYKNFLFKKKYKILKNKKILNFIKYFNINNLYNKNFISHNKNIKEEILKKIYKKFYNNKKIYKLFIINGIINKKISNIGPWIIKKNSNLKFKKIKYNNFIECFIDLFDYKYTLFLNKNNDINYPLELINININNNNFINKNNINLSKSYLNININNNKKNNKIFDFFIDLNSNNNFNISNRKINITNKSKLEYISIYKEKIYENNTISNYIFNIKNKSILNNNTFLLNKNNLYLNYVFNINNKSICKNNSFSFSSENINYINNTINHKFNNTFSYQIHKSISRLKSKNIFYNTVNIKKKISNVDGYIYYNGLIKDNTSEIILCPKLNILSNNVSFKHGLTVSDIDENDITYFLSRCISENNFITIKTISFLLEIIKNIKYKFIKKYIYNLIINKINKV